MDVQVISLSCPTCGAVVESAEEQLSTVCYFCDAAVVKTTSIAAHRLEEVLPFKVNQQQARSALLHTLQNKWFVPKSLRQKTAPDEIHGMYVPFWVLKATANSEYSAQIGINYQEIETYTERDSNGNMVTKTRTVTRTDWHHLHGSHIKQYEDHIICASKVLNNQEVDRIEPFDFGHALQFAPEAIAGWRSEVPTTTKDEAFKSAVSEIHSEEHRAIKSFLTGDSNRLENVQTNVTCDRSDIRAALLPIWIATFRFQGKTLRMLVNGQTGQVGGDIPTDWQKVAWIVVGILIMIGFIGVLAQ